MLHFRQLRLAFSKSYTSLLLHSVNDLSMDRDTIDPLFLKIIQLEWNICKLLFQRFKLSSFFYKNDIPFLHILYLWRELQGKQKTAARILRFHADPAAAVFLLSYFTSLLFHWRCSVLITSGLYARCGRYRRDDRDKQCDDNDCSKNAQCYDHSSRHTSSSCPYRTFYYLFLILHVFSTSASHSVIESFSPFRYSDIQPVQGS